MAHWQPRIIAARHLGTPRQSAQLARSIHRFRVNVALRTNESTCHRPPRRLLPCRQRGCPAKEKTQLITFWAPDPIAARHARELAVCPFDVCFRGMAKSAWMAEMGGKRTAEGGR